MGPSASVGAHAAAPLSLRQARAMLDEQHYGLDKIKDRCVGVWVGDSGCGRCGRCVEDSGAKLQTDGQGATASYSRCCPPRLPSFIPHPGMRETPEELPAYASARSSLPIPPHSLQVRTPPATPLPAPTSKCSPSCPGAACPHTQQPLRQQGILPPEGRLEGAWGHQPL